MEKESYTSEEIREAINELNKTKDEEEVHIFSPEEYAVILSMIS